MREKIAEIKVEDLTGETERKLIRQEIIKEFQSEIEKLDELHPEEVWDILKQNGYKVNPATLALFGIGMQAQLAKTKSDLMKVME